MKPLPVVTSGAVASKPALAVVAFLPSERSPEGSSDEPGWLERMIAVFVGLESCGNCPFHVMRVINVDVLVHDYAVL